MKKTLVLICLVVSPAYAEEYMLKVDANELNLISDGLMTQPYGKVMPLMQKLREQYIAQQPKPPVQAPAPAPEAKPADTITYCELCDLEWPLCVGECEGKKKEAVDKKVDTGEECK
jgi:hypothetical protein